MAYAIATLPQLLLLLTVISRLAGCICSKYGVYYHAAYKTLFLLLCMALILYFAACYFGYWLAERNIRPISNMYAKQQQFTADASHEMRTPLAVMKLAVQGLQEDEDSRLSDFAKESVNMLQSESERLSRLTENLMTLARSDENILPVYTAQVDITALCKGCIADVAFGSRKKAAAEAGNPG